MSRSCTSFLWKGTITLLGVAVLRLRGVEAFIDEILSQAFGGGGGGQQFHFQMGGGGGFQQMHMGGQPKQVRWPKGISEEIGKKFTWLKGTEWHWNGWRNVKFEKDGSFDAPTRECQQGQCKWSAPGEDRVYILWGSAGLHTLKLVGEMPPDASDPNKLQGLQLKGKRNADGDRVAARFVRVFDFEAMELDKDLYDMLGLDDHADDAALKKAYRKLSIKYHPDKNPDPESQRKFKDVRDAYEILNNPDKKILYDTGGMEAVKAMDKGEVEKGEDIGIDLAVSLSDLYNSATSSAQINRRVVCRGCRVKPDHEKCKGCRRCPNEVKMVNRQVGPGMFIQQQQEVQSKEKCKDEHTMIDVQIEKGMSDGEKVKFERMSEQRPGMIPGAVIFTLKVNKDPRFTRKGNDLHVKTKISLEQALLGFRQKIKHLDGHTVEFGTDGVTKPFQVFKIKGEGMPLRDDPASFGYLYVTVEVGFPKSLPRDQRDVVKSLFHDVSPSEEL